LVLNESAYHTPTSSLKMLSYMAFGPERLLRRMLLPVAEQAATYLVTGGIVQRFLDPVAEEIYHTGFSPRLPKGIVRKAYTRIRLLVAAQSLQDVGLMGSIARSSKDDGVYGVAINGKWFIWFKWEDLVGAYDIKLGRWKPRKGQG
jgi:plasmid maintenance system killer protein